MPEVTWERHRVKVFGYSTEGGSCSGARTPHPPLMRSKEIDPEFIRPRNFWPILTLSARENRQEAARFGLAPKISNSHDCILVAVRAISNWAGCGIRTSSSSYCLYVFFGRKSVNPRSWGGRTVQLMKEIFARAPVFATGHSAAHDSVTIISRNQRPRTKPKVGHRKIANSTKPYLEENHYPYITSNFRRVPV